jgi:Fe(3+) dicitrate transport protein
LVPGLAVVEEDAFGVKLNVSVRGLSPRRSGRTLLLEDGIPIQPAPYADPSAHYYPPMDRVEQIEVRRGSVQIPYGPQSVGGVINFVTRPAPLSPSVVARMEVGARNWFSGHVTLGAGDGETGIGVSLTHKAGDGIREAHDTQLDEGVVRGQWRLTDRQTLDLSFAHYEERTRLTEGGLDQARYDISPYYNPFRNDVFALDRTAARLTHQWRIADTTSLTTQVFSANTFRASYRQADTSTDAMTANPLTGCVGVARTDYERFASLCGNKMRPRRFEFAGIEARLDLAGAFLGGQGRLDVGLRAMHESTDRKRYNGLFPEAREASVGTVLRDQNQIRTNAIAGHVLASWSRDGVTVTPGLRIEDVKTKNTAFTANFLPVRRTTENRKATLLPGLGLAFSPADHVTVFAGVHRGFAPPRPDRDFDPNAPFNAVRPEKSLETEVGLRLRSPEMRLQAVLFDMQLDDLIVEGPLVGGRSGSFVNAGEAAHRGLEISGERKFGALTLSGAYSWLFTAEFAGDVDLGAVGVRGNRIPYAPEHAFDLAVAVQASPEFEADLGVNFLDEQFANASNERKASSDGQRGLIPARTLWRAALHYKPRNAPVRVYVSAQNLADKAYVSSRVDGLFAGAPRTVVAGVEARF